jgi:hypothetical protein
MIRLWQVLLPRVSFSHFGTSLDNNMSDNITINTHDKQQQPTTGNNKERDVDQYHDDKTVVG